MKTNINKLVESLEKLSQKKVKLTEQFDVDAELLRQDFENIKSHNFFEVIRLQPPHITIEGSQTVFYPERNYERKDFGEYVEIRDVVDKLKQVRGWNYVYSIQKEDIPFVQSSDPDDELEERTEALFILTPIKKVGK